MEEPKKEFELLPDPIPILTLPPEEPEPELAEEQKEYKHKREKAQKCKVIALSDMGLPPIHTNTSYMASSLKKTLLREVEKLFVLEDSIVNERFNEICIEKIFSDDYTIFPIYKKSLPIQI
jgi:hypothetical protein